MYVTEELTNYVFDIRNQMLNTAKTEAINWACSYERPF
jgi:hypothetical protein